MGSRNRRTADFLAVLERHNFCAASALIECYREARKVYDNYGVIYDAIVDARISKNDQDGSFAAPPEDQAHKYLKIASDIAKEIASYSFPKLKSVEQTKDNPLANMTAREKLEAMRQAVALLEAEVKAEDDGSGDP